MAALKFWLILCGLVLSGYALFKNLANCLELALNHRQSFE